MPDSCPASCSHLEPFITGEKRRSPKMLTLNMLVNQKPSHCYNSKTNLVVSTKENPFDYNIFYFPYFCSWFCLFIFFFRKQKTCYWKPLYWIQKLVLNLEDHFSPKTYTLRKKKTYRKCSAMITSIHLCSLLLSMYNCV